MRRRVVLTALVVPACGLLAAAGAVDLVGAREEPLEWRPNTAVVVFGARVEASGLASKTLEARVLHAARLVKHAPDDTVLIISGGVGTFGRAEAEVGAELAVQAGVDEARVRRERFSHSTRENARFSADLLHELGVRDVVVVTDPYHVPRARFELTRLGFHVQASPVLEAPRHLDPVERARWALREVPALLRAWLNDSPGSEARAL